MKKYTLYLLCLFMTIYAYNGVNSVVATTPDIALLMPNTCHTFLGIDFLETKEIIPGSRHPNFWDDGKTYSYDYKKEFSCTQADIEYDDFLKNNVYPFLYILLALSSGLGYLGYKKYKAKKLMSNIETKNTSPVNPE